MVLYHNHTTLAGGTGHEPLIAEAFVAFPRPQRLCAVFCRETLHPRSSTPRADGLWRLMRVGGGAEAFPFCVVLMTSAATTTR